MSLGNKVKQYKNPTMSQFILAYFKAETNISSEIHNHLIMKLNKKQILGIWGETKK